MLVRCGTVIFKNCIMFGNNKVECKPYTIQVFGMKFYNINTIVTG